MTDLAITPQNLQPGVSPRVPDTVNNVYAHHHIRSPNTPCREHPSESLQSRVWQRLAYVFSVCCGSRRNDMRDRPDIHYVSLPTDIDIPLEHQGELGESAGSLSSRASLSNTSINSHDLQEANRNELLTGHHTYTHNGIDYDIWFEEEEAAKSTNSSTSDLNRVYPLQNIDFLPGQSNVNFTPPMIDKSSEEAHAIIEGHKNDVPSYVVHSEYINGVYQNRHQLEESSTEGIFPPKAGVIQNYSLDTIQNYSGSSTAPLETSLLEDPDAVPNEQNWIWFGSKIKKHDLACMLDFANNHPLHKLSVWTDGPDELQAALNDFSIGDVDHFHSNDKMPTSTDFESVANFKKRLNIQSPKTLFKDNGLSDEQNKKLYGIYLREKNGIHRNYAAVSDILRLMILLKHGGLYLDVDVKILRAGVPIALEDNARTMENLRAPVGLLKVDANTNILAATKMARLIIKCLERIIAYYEYGASPLNNQYNHLKTSLNSAK